MIAHGEKLRALRMVYKTLKRGGWNCHPNWEAWEQIFQRKAALHQSEIERIWLNIARGL